MSEELGIYVTVYDKFSPAIKSMGNNTKAFDKAHGEMGKEKPPRWGG